MQMRYPPQVIAIYGRKFTITVVGASKGSAGTSSVAAAASPPQAVNEAKHTRWCLVWGRVTGESLGNREFVADIGGVRQSGKTDGQGYAKIETDGEQLFNIHVLFSSPKRVLKPHQGN
jgi:hypothetical protein